jgi:hypothetical protein
LEKASCRIVTPNTRARRRHGADDVRAVPTPLDREPAIDVDDRRTA